ncbi:MAG: type IV pilus biogenesis protein PilP [Luteimonas sp.]
MDIKGRHTALILVLLASAPLVVQAQSVGDLANVQAETLFIKAKAARAEALSKLAEASLQGSTASSQETASNDSLPVVRGVYGSAEKLYATFLYANGSTVDAGKGDVIPGGYNVRSLSATRVELGRRGRSFTVGFSDVPPPMPTASNASTGPSAPPQYLPPPMLPMPAPPPGG